MKCCGNKEKEELRAENARMRRQVGTLTDLMEKQTQALMRMEAKANAAEQKKRQSDNESLSSFSSKLRSPSGVFGCSSNPKRQNSQQIIRRSSSLDSVTSRGSRKSNPKETIALAHYGFPDMYQHEEKLAEHLGRFEQWGENKPIKKQLSGTGFGRL
eukprot:CAMPEP_0183437786 /NCGR_PEP_ID=MMETSP0370-20130417/74594_1 /TAXON_ID=268820 /ORGANISM="Peridinium aciculiferum, Strain PAER-2" /LENGTH=156 /DNA_ID=CAMNT_0025625751 /DNA_START=117 /DNA_END=587 /DNA_ORIENTATION=+